MQKRNCVAGIYIERTGAQLLLMSATRTEPKHWWNLNYIAHEPYISWSPHNKNEAIDGLNYLLEIVKQHPEKPEGIGVACNGPFKSLHPSPSLDYGKLHPEYADPPLKGESLSEIVLARLGSEWGLKRLQSNTTAERKPFVIHTDANACALGEAYTRNLTLPDKDKNRTLAFIICGEGIGLGITRGPGILTSALHPEVGLLHTVIKDGDRLRPDDTDDNYELSIAQLANDKALIDRLSKIQGRSVLLGDVVKFLDKDFWDLRAYYLSQACLACTIVVPPNVIAIGARVDPLGNVGQSTREHLRKFFKKRADDWQPLIDYTDAAKPNFVSNSVANRQLPIALEHSLATTGALGMCYEAASIIDFGTVQSMRTHMK